MDTLKIALVAVSKGERSFTPESGDEADIRLFQPLAQAFLHAKKEGLIGDAYCHKNAIFGEWLIDLVVVSEGLTYKGMKMVETWADDARPNASAERKLRAYEPDFSKVGDVRYRRKTYETVHRALERLLNAVYQWNQVAISHGVSRAPYQREEDHLANIVAWGKGKLNTPGISDVVVKGMSVESLRLERAALEFAAVRTEQEIRAKSIGMPPAVVDSMLGHAREYAAEAKKIEQLAHPILDELLHESAGQGRTVPASSHEWDVFVSHASEDKDAIARPLAVALRKEGLRVWFDEAVLTLGDNLRQSIDLGLARSRHGIVILSNAFFLKHWPPRELDGLAAREIDGETVILPVWHGIDRATVARYSPMLAGRLAVSSSLGVPAMVGEILKAVRR